MLSSGQPPLGTVSHGARLSLALHQSAGRATFKRFMEALSKIQKKVMIRFNAGGTLEIVQLPDLTSGIAHVWITSNREVFGFEEYSLNVPSLVLEVPVRPLLAILQSCEGLDTLQVAYEDPSGRPSPKIIISSCCEYFTFSSVMHEVPVAKLSASQSDSYFREPLIAKPSITFTFPSVSVVHDKLLRLVKHADSVSLAANQQGRLLVGCTGTMLRTEFTFSAVPVISAQVSDPLELQHISVSIDAFVKVLKCLGILQTVVVSAVAPDESLILSAKLPNPCGHDRPAGSITLIIGAFDPN